MNYSLSHLSDGALLRDLAALVSKDRATTAALLAHLAEVDARKLYLPAAYPSMYLYCVHELRMSEGSAFKLIRAARTARKFPAMFDAVAEGRLHVSAVVLLTPYLNPENVDGLVVASTHKTKSDIELLLAERYPRTDVLALAGALSSHAAPADPLALEQAVVSETSCQLSPGTVDASMRPPREMVPGHVEASKARVAPISGSSVALQVTLEKSTYEKLQYAKELLSHRIPSGDLAQVLDRAMDALIRQLEKQKFAATSAPRPARRQPVAGERFVPAYVKRAVWRRDGGQCTFVSESGHRCPARTLLEFVHTVEVARGGQATVGGMRLRCRAHNQHTAEQTFGAGFMEQKQRAAMDAAPERRRSAVTKDQFGVGDVVTCLRALGIRTGDALFAAKASSGMPEAPIETRVRVALKAYGARRFGAPCPT